MATTKTLTPTNQAITLAAFTEKPDNRTNVTNDDKLADAVNTLNSNKANNTIIANVENGSTFTKAHSVGDYIIDANRELRLVVNQAAVGDTITSKANKVPDGLASQVTALNSNLAALTNLYHSTGLHINETGTLTEDVTNYHFALFHFQTNSEHAYQLIPTDNLVGQMIHQTIVGARDNGEITYPPNYNASTNVRLTTTTTVICGMEIYNNVNFKCNLKDIYGVWRK